MSRYGSGALAVQGIRFSYTGFTTAYACDSPFRSSENRELDLAPGDCELMAQLRDQVLTESGVRIMQESISCFPYQVSITTPTLQVSSLAPAISNQSS